jgi:uncharacterized membrane protein YgdD (TMEM256/DUF423 family)
MTHSESWTTVGGVFAGLAVALGAFAAHGLDKVLTEKYAGEVRTVAGQDLPASAKYLADFKTGATYQMYHALALVAVGLLSRQGRQTSLQLAGWCFVLGTLLFSGSLYVLVVGGPRWLGVPWGMVAPFGGVSLILGWVAFAVGARQTRFGVDCSLREQKTSARGASSPR